MGWFSGSTELHEIPLTAEQKEAREYILRLLRRPAGKRIPTLGIAGPSGVEEQALQLLRGYLSGPPRGYEAAMGELEGTLSGQYDPRTSDLYKGFREESRMEEEQGVSRLRRGAQAGGMFYSGPSMRTEATLRSRAGAERTSMLGAMSERERERKAAAVPQLMAGGQIPAQQAAIGMQLGALERELEQARYQAQYQRIMQKLMAPYQMQAPLAESLWGMTPDYYLTQSQGAAGMLGAAAGGAASALLAPAAGAAASGYVGGAGSFPGMAQSNVFGGGGALSFGSYGQRPDPYGLGL